MKPKGSITAILTILLSLLKQSLELGRGFMCQFSMTRAYFTQMSCVTRSIYAMERCHCKRKARDMQYMCLTSLLLLKKLDASHCQNINLKRMQAYQTSSSFSAQMLMKSSILGRIMMVSGQMISLSSKLVITCVKFDSYSL